MGILDSKTGHLAAVSLDTLERSASLQTRVDRKYIVASELATEFVAAAGDDVSVLEVGGERAFGYQSVYFDTAGHDLHRLAATRRPSRFKVRIRNYSSSPTPMLEIKVRTGRGQNEKHRFAHEATRSSALDDDDRTRIESVVGASPFIDHLRPALTTSYLRTTLLRRHENLDGGDISRATIDVAVSGATPDGRRTRIDAVVIETKTEGRPSAFDEWLWRHGHRPVRMSKYSTLLCALTPQLPSNKWHRTLRRHFSADDDLQV